MFSYFYLACLSLVSIYAIEQWLRYRQRKRYYLKNISTSLNEYINIDIYNKCQAYALEKSNIKLIQDAVNIIHSIFRLYRLSWFWAMAGSISSNNIIQSLVFVSALSLEKTIINIPFALYHTFIVRPKYKSEKPTIPKFFINKIKMLVYRGGISLPLIAIFLKVEPFLGNSFWIYAWFAVLTQTIGVWMLYPRYIVPWCRDLAPVPEGNLKDSLKHLSQLVGFPVDRIYIDKMVCTSCKNSCSGNSYATYIGLFWQKILVISESATMVHDISTIMSLAVHELGKWYGMHRAVWYSLRMLYMGCNFYMLQKLIYCLPIYNDFDVEYSFIIGYVILGFIYAPIDRLYLLIENIIMRNLEYRADQFAINCGYDMKNALIKTKISNLSKMEFDPYYSIYFNQKPTLVERLKRITIKFKKMC